MKIPEALRSWMQIAILRLTPYPANEVAAPQHLGSRNAAARADFAFGIIAVIIV